MVTHYATIAQGFAFEMKFGNCLTRFEHYVLFEFRNIQNASYVYGWLLGNNNKLGIITYPSLLWGQHL